MDVADRYRSLTLAILAAVHEDRFEELGALFDARGRALEDLASSPCAAPADWAKAMDEDAVLAGVLEARRVDLAGELVAHFRDVRARQAYLRAA